MENFVGRLGDIVTESETFLCLDTDALSLRGIVRGDRGGGDPKPE